MPRISSLLAWLLLVPIAAVAAENKMSPDVAMPQPDKQWVNLHNHLTGLVTQAAGKAPLDIYFLGDSITEFWPEDGKAVWEKEFGKLHVLNCGVRSDTTQNILYRITNGEFERIHPKVVVLLAGINNLGQSATVTPEALSKGLGKIIVTLHAKSPESKILLISILPSGGEPTDPIRKRIQTVNALLPALADNKSIFFLDIYSRFLDEKGVLPADISPDEVHLTSKGYQILADAMREKLQGLLGSSADTQ